MKAITIKPEWVEKILSGEKTLEIRTWTTHYRGALAIHSGAPVSSIVAIAEIVDCRLMLPSDSAAAGGVPYSPGLRAWVLGNVRRIKPIPCKGKLSLWTPPLEVLTRAGS